MVGGSSIPSAFDMVLTPQQVLSVAVPFISGGCDPVAALGLTRTFPLLLLLFLRRGYAEDKQLQH